MSETLFTFAVGVLVGMYGMWRLMFRRFERDLEEVRQSYLRLRILNPDKPVVEL